MRKALMSAVLRTLRVGLGRTATASSSRRTALELLGDPSERRPRDPRAVCRRLHRGPVVKVTELRFIAPPETAVLTPEQLAAWLQVSGRQLDRMGAIPYFLAGGTRSKRYLVRTVLAHLEAEARKETAA